MKNKQVEKTRKFLEERIESLKTELEQIVKYYVDHNDSLTDEECKDWMLHITSCNVSIYIKTKRLKQLDNPDEPMPSTRMTRWREAYYKKYHNKKI